MKDVKSLDPGDSSCSPLSAPIREWRPMTTAEQARRMAWRFKVIQEACAWPRVSSHRSHQAG